MLILRHTSILWDQMCVEIALSCVVYMTNAVLSSLLPTISQVTSHQTYSGKGASRTKVALGNLQQNLANRLAEVRRSTDLRVRLNGHVTQSIGWTRKAVGQRQCLVVAVRWQHVFRDRGANAQHRLIARSMSLTYRSHSRPGTTVRGDGRAIGERHASSGNCNIKSNWQS